MARDQGSNIVSQKDINYRKKKNLLSFLEGKRPVSTTEKKNMVNIKANTTVVEFVSLSFFFFNVYF